MRHIGLGVILAACSWGQILEIAATADGREVLLATSFRPAGEGGRENVRQRLIRGGRDGAWRTLAPTAEDPIVPGYYSDLILSGDGKIASFRRHPACTFRCMFVFPTREIVGVELADPLPSLDSVRLSANARFMLVVGQDAQAFRVVRLYDLRDRRYVDLRRERVGLAIPGSDEGRFAVTDRGEVLLSENGQLFLLDAELRRTDPFPEKPAAAAWLAGAGTRLIYAVVGEQVEYRLRERNTSVDRLLFAVPKDSQQPVNISISADERRLVYSVRGEAKRIELATGEMFDLGPVAISGQRTALVTADGESVIVVRPDQRVERQRLSTGERETLAPAFGDVELDRGVAAPGSLWRLRSEAFAKLPDTYRLSTASAPVPVAEIVGRDEVLFQVPWEQPVNRALQLVLSKREHPWELVLEELTVLTLAPRFALNGPRGAIKASHEDFRGLVTPEDPARPGETIHTYLFGLGPVTPEVATGEKSPDPPALIRAEARCFLATPGLGRLGPAASVPFAGMMPGFVGVYQMDVTLPRGLSAEYPELFCQFVNAAGLTSASGPLSIRVD